MFFKDVKIPVKYIESKKFGALSQVARYEKATYSEVERWLSDARNIYGGLGYYTKAQVENNPIIIR